MPLHTKASQFAASGLFNGITTFEELEKRISSINENKKGGSLCLLTSFRGTLERLMDS